MKLTDVLGCAGGAAFLLFASTFIPFVGPFMSLVTPLLFLFYGTKLGLDQGVKVSALSILAVGALANLAGQPQLLVFCIEFAVLGIALAVLFKSKLSFGRTIFFAVATMVLLGVGFLFFLGLTRNVGPSEVLLGYLRSQIDGTVAIYKETGISQESAAELEAYARALMATVSRIYPSLMIIGVGFAVWLNVLMARPLFRLARLEYPDFSHMDRWRAPDRLVWGLIASGFALFLTEGGIQSCAVNALIIIMVVYFFHGLSICLYFLNKYRVPPLIRLGVYFLIIIQQLFLVVLALAGLFDQWVDFRRIQRRANR